MTKAGAATFVLLVEDNPGDVELFREALSEIRVAPFEIDVADRLRSALSRLESKPAVDVVLLDLGLPDSSGIETLLELKRAAPSVPVVVLTGRDDEALAVRALQEGAQDYLVKGKGDGDLVARSIRYAIERQRAESARLHLAEEQFARKLAEEALRGRDEFISIAAHELKTPLTPLALHLELLRRLLGEAGGDGWDSRLPRIMVKLDQSANAVDRLRKLIDSLLDVSRITAGHFQLDLGEMELCQVVREVVERFSDEMSRAGCACTLQAATEITGVWDRLRVEQVIMNLLSNAIKYGAGKPVEVVVASNGTMVELTVRDHGIGIARETLARIFERFERGETRLRIGGLGLGLYIARQIAQAHGGSIEATSEIGTGSSFTVRLPLRA